MNFNNTCLLKLPECASFLEKLILKFPIGLEQIQVHLNKNVSLKLHCSMLQPWMFLPCQCVRSHWHITLCLLTFIEDICKPSSISTYHSSFLIYLLIPGGCGLSLEHLFYCWSYLLNSFRCLSCELCEPHRTETIPGSTSTYILFLVEYCAFPLRTLPPW